MGRASSDAAPSARPFWSAPEHHGSALSAPRRACEATTAQLGESRKAREQLQEAADAAAENEALALRQQSEWRAMFKQASAREEALLEELKASCPPTLFAGLAWPVCPPCALIAAQAEKSARARLETMLGGLHERLRKQARGPLAPFAPGARFPQCQAPSSTPDPFPRLLLTRRRTTSCPSDGGCAPTWRGTFSSRHPHRPHWPAPARSRRAPRSACSV